MLGQNAVLAGDSQLQSEAGRALARLARDGDESAREELCRLVIHHDLPVVERHVLAAGYAPAEESQRALFYFLTQQWKDYEALDFDQRLLSAVYHAGSERLRARIAIRARKAGRIEWVEIAAGGRQGKRLRAMSDAEWKAVLVVLHENERWDSMWQLAQEAPARWSVALLRRLHAEGWTPPPDDHDDFDLLTSLSEMLEHRDYRLAFLCKAVLEGHQDEVRALAFSPDGNFLVSSGTDRGVIVWDPHVGKSQMVLSGPAGQVNCVAVTPDGRHVITGDKEGTAHVWRLPAGQPVAKLKGHSQKILRLSVGRDNRTLATAGADGGIQLWDLTDFSSIATLEGHGGSILDMLMTPAGNLLATASGDCTVRLWTLPHGKPCRTLQGHRAEEADAVLCLAISPDGELLASGGTDASIQLWELPSGHHRETLEGHFGPVISLCFSTDGTMLASGGADHNIRFWRIPSGDAVASIEAHSGDVTHLAMSADGQVLASASGSGFGHDYSLRLWSPHGRGAIRSLYGHNRYLSCLAMSPDGKYIATGSGDRTVRLWSAELHRLTRLPIRQTTLEDLDLAHRTLEATGLPDDERQMWMFLATLMRRQRRLDVLVEDAAPHIVEVGEYDIEI
jgi:WD40 repeat protein